MSFLQRSNDRTLPADFVGDVYVWDIDKTYLDTHFSSLRGLLAIPFEWAVDKRALPGTVPLLRALRHGPGAESALSPLYFVSGSPPQLRRVVEKKMVLDGVQPDGITFKDQWGLVKARTPQAIVEQVGYKLKALLLYRKELPAGARYLLFGDDSERDLDSFLTFGEICAGLRGPALAERLAALGCWRPDIEGVVTLADATPVVPDPVVRVFIHEVRGHARLGSESAFSRDPRVVKAPSFLQHALVLRQLGRIRAEDVRAVHADVVRAGVDTGPLLSDARDRLGVPAEVLAELEGSARPSAAAPAGSGSRGAS